MKLKVYEERLGENRMHHHDGEDHCFVILQGEATFRLGTDDNVVVLNQGDGILIERGDDYWFENTGAVDLQILRVGAIDPSKPQHANFADGAVKHGRKD